MSLVETMLKIKNEGFTLTFREGLCGDDFTMKIVIEKTLLLKYKEEYILTDELLIISREEGLSIILTEMFMKLKRAIKG